MIWGREPVWGENEDMGFLGGVLDMGATLAAIGVVIALIVIVVPLLITPPGITLVGILAVALIAAWSFRRLR